MKKIIVLLLLAVFGVQISFAEEPSNSVSPIIATPINDSPLFASTPPTPPCKMKQKSTLTPASPLMILKSIKCEAPDENIEEFYEVMDINKKTFFINADDVEIQVGEVERLETMTAKDFADLRKKSIAGIPVLKKIVADQNYDREYFKRTDKAGLALIQTRIFDVSEHTEGTGYSVMVINSSKKTIKYISFTVIGYNSVNDPVRPRNGKGTSLTLRGVGPIEPGSPAEYSWDYAWFTDLVETHKLKMITVQYMDGSKKTFTDMKAITAPAKIAEKLLES